MPRQSVCWGPRREAIGSEMWSRVIASHTCYMLLYHHHIYIYTESMKIVYFPTIDMGPGKKQIQYDAIQKKGLKLWEIPWYPLIIKPGTWLCSLVTFHHWSLMCTRTASCPNVFDIGRATPKIGMPQTIWMTSITKSRVFRSRLWIFVELFFASLTRPTYLFCIDHQVAGHTADLCRKPTETGIPP